MKKKIFALILVFIFAFSFPASAYQINEYELHCDAAMVISLDTGDVLYAKNHTERLYPASITKLMTAIVMVENIDDLDNTYMTYTKTANNLILGTGSVVYNLNIGEKMKAREALASLLITSHGDTAYMIAEHVGGTIENFVDMMNKKAEEMGLSNTHFVNPVGLHDDEHYTTAEDIYVFAKYAFEIDVIKEMASKATYKMEATNVHGERTIANSNLLINPNSNVYYEPAICGKTGFTDEAGRCLVSVASNGVYNYMAIVLNAKTQNGKRYDFIDSENIFRWAFNTFEYKTVLEPSTPVDEVKVNLSSDADHVSVVLEGGLKSLLPKDADLSTVQIKTNLFAEEINAPVQKGAVLGTADIYYAEEKIGTINLIAANGVESDKFKVFVEDAKTVSKNFFTSTIMKVFYALVIIVVVGFIALTVWLNLTKKKRRKLKYKPIKKSELEDQNNP